MHVVGNARLPGGQTLGFDHLRFLIRTNTLTPAATPPRYYCSIIGLRPEKEAEYRKLHACVWPEVRSAIRKANIRDFNIYIEVVNGKKYLVSHFEYVGKDPDKDFALIAKDPTTKNKWWPLTDACQVVLKGTPTGQQWLPIEQVMHLD